MMRGHALTKMRGHMLASQRRFVQVTPLPYRIRVPLAKLQQKKALPEEAFREPALGDGEALETNAEFPDYVALALRAKIYDHMQESPPLCSGPYLRLA